jgi:hypothetical protein
MKLKRLRGARVNIIAALALLVPEIAIAETLSGTDAIKAVIGKPVIVEIDDNTLIFNFVSEFDLRLKRPAPANDEISGKVTRGSDSSKVCLSFGDVIPSRCFQLDLDGNKFIMTKRGGERTFGTVMMGLNLKPEVADQPAEEGDPRICAPLRSIAEAAKGKFGLESLVNLDVKPITNEDPNLNDTYTSKIKLGHCLLDIHSSVQRHICLVSMKESDPEAVKLYKHMTQQVQLCLADMITNSKVSTKIKKSATKTNVSSSSYELGDTLRFTVSLGSNGRCSDIIYEGCEDGYGVYIGTSVGQ